MNVSGEIKYLVKVLILTMVVVMAIMTANRIMMNMTIMMMMVVVNGYTDEDERVCVRTDVRTHTYMHICTHYTYVRSIGKYG